MFRNGLVLSRDFSPRRCCEVVERIRHTSCPRTVAHLPENTETILPGNLPTPQTPSTNSARSASQPKDALVASGLSRPRDGLVHHERQQVWQSEKEQQALFKRIDQGSEEYVVPGPPRAEVIGLTSGSRSELRKLREWYSHPQG